MEFNDEINLAVCYRLLAVNFQLSATILSENLEWKADGTPAKLTAIPFYFMISHAAELFLKSALLKRGFTGKELKKFDYRHNLKGLLQALCLKGVTITVNTAKIIEGLHSQHQTHALRYTVFIDEGKKTFCPSFGWCFEALDELLLLTRISTQGV